MEVPEFMDDEELEMLFKGLEYIEKYSEEFPLPKTDN